MPKAARIPTSVPVSSETEQSDTGQFVSVALFSGIGLLISLIAVPFIILLPAFMVDRRDAPVEAAAPRIPAGKAPLEE